MPFRLGGSIDGQSPGAARRVLYRSDDNPLRGAAATLVLPAGAADAASLDFLMLWFYGDATHEFADRSYRGRSEGVWVRDASGDHGAHAKALNNQNSWISFHQAPQDPRPDTWTVGLLNKTASTGWSLEYNPATRALSLLEYGDTGTGANGTPNIADLLVLSL